MKIYLAATASLLLFLLITPAHAALRGGGLDEDSRPLRKLEEFTDCPGSHPCNSRQDCIDGACVCKTGYMGVNCHNDVDECTTLDPKPCSFPGGACVNHAASAGYYTCDCMSGWSDGPMGDHGVESCDDVDECLTNPCHVLAICENEVPGYTCTCEGDLVGDGVTTCEPPPMEEAIDPCEEKGCDAANSYCVIDASTMSPVCLCLPGFSQLRPDSQCRDIAECEDGSICPPNAFCQEQDGGYECLCEDGYVGGGDFCTDIDECENADACSGFLVCINNIGSFDCVEPPSTAPSSSPTAMPTPRPTNPPGPSPTMTNPPPGSSSVAATVPTEGGMVMLPGIATVSIPSGTFPAAAGVTVRTTENTAVAATFEETSAIFNPGNRLTYEVEIVVNQVPQTETVPVTLTVPAELIATLDPADAIEVFALAESGDPPIQIFILIPGRVYDAAAGTISFDLPGSAFIEDTGAGMFTATVTLAPTPGGGGTTRRHLQGTSACQGTSIRCPLGSFGCTVTSSFNPARLHPTLGTVRPHYGVDYRAPIGTPIVAAAGGTVERSYTSSSYGETILLRHTDGAATLYAHLSVRNVAAGATVSVGQQLGLSGNTGRSSGPHLHFEYAPSGRLIQSKNRIDPHPCVGAVTSGSITAGDNGNLADDAFELFLDGISIGETTIGGTNNLSINNLIPKTYTLQLVTTVAPDNCATWFIRLNDGLEFTTGGTFRQFARCSDFNASFQIIVPANP